LALISRGHAPAARLTSPPVGGVVCAGSGETVEASSPRTSTSARTFLTLRDITVALLRKPGVWKQECLVCIHEARCVRHSDEGALMPRRDALVLVATPFAVVSSGQGCSRSAISSETRCRRSGLARRRSS